MTFDASDVIINSGFTPTHLVIYAEYQHWWQRLWARLRGKTVLWSGPVLPLEAVDFDQDTMNIVVDASGRFWITPSEVK